MESYNATEDVFPARLGKEDPDHQSSDLFECDGTPAAYLRHEKVLLTDCELHPGSSFSVPAFTDAGDSTYGSNSAGLPSQELLLPDEYEDRTPPRIASEEEELYSNHSSADRSTNARGLPIGVRAVDPCRKRRHAFDDYNMSGGESGIWDSGCNPAEERLIGRDTIHHSDSTSDEEEVYSDCSSFPQTESSQNTLECDLPPSILASIKQEYIEQIISAFDRSRQECDSCPATEHQGSNGQSQSKIERNEAAPDSRRKSGERRAKRRKIDSTDEGCEDDPNHGEDGGDNSQGPSSDIDTINSGLLWACPFAKWDPQRYRKCGSQTLRDVPRVKSHLQRSKYHQIPIYCPRCSTTFDSEGTRDDHVRENTCPIRDLLKPEGISSVQRQQLTKRISPKNSERENWYLMFRIVLPDAPLPSSPYIDTALPDGLTTFQDFQRSEGPAIFMNVLARAQWPEDLRDRQDQIQTLHHAVFLDALEAMYEIWRSRNRTAHTRNNATHTRPYSSSRNQLPARSVVRSTRAPFHLPRESEPVSIPAFLADDNVDTSRQEMNKQDVSISTPPPTPPSPPPRSSVPSVPVTATAIAAPLAPASAARTKVPPLDRTNAFVGLSSSDELQWLSDLPEMCSVFDDGFLAQSIGLMGDIGIENLQPSLPLYPVEFDTSVPQSSSGTLDTDVGAILYDTPDMADYVSLSS